MYLEGHSTVDNLRNYMVQVSESSASFDASFTLTCQDNIFFKIRELILFNIMLA